MHVQYSTIWIADDAHQTLIENSANCLSALAYVLSIASAAAVRVLQNNSLSHYKLSNKSY